MLLTLKTKRYPASDLGYLLHKNPAKMHSFDVSVGKAHLFFPEVGPQECCAALLLDIDPISLVKTKKGHFDDSFILDQYVNDRPYVASSFLSMAIARVFRDSLKGVCKDKPELLSSPWPFEASIFSLPSQSRSGQELIRSLFEPLGYHVAIEAVLLNENNRDWGEAETYTVHLKKECYLKELLSHLYVLIPVLDNQKHYWISEHEVEKLMTHGQGWLSSHPNRDLIMARYLKRQRDLIHAASARLEEQDGLRPDIREKNDANEEQALEQPLLLHLLRMQAVVDVLKKHGAASVVDLGCGEGILIGKLLDDPLFKRILGVDVSYKHLERAKQKLKLEFLPPTQAKRVSLVHGSLNYLDKRIWGFDAATLVEVIEHLDVQRLSTLEYVVFGDAKPQLVIVTTPNVEYNVKFEQLPAGTFRHRDHRFEWTRKEFAFWAEKVALQYGYAVEFDLIGPVDDHFGSPTQMAIFSKIERRGTNS